MMFRILLAFVALLASACVATPEQHSASGLELIDYTDEFDQLWERTAQLDDAARAAAFKRHFEAILPGFYSHERHGMPDAKAYDALLLEALKEYPQQRAATQAMSRRFASLLAPAERSFEREFGAMTGFPPIILVNSLGEFDGGMRTLPGGTHLMFGADVMARIYADKDVEPFFHHELFHLFQTRGAPEDCPAVWCNLWGEGLATYVAHRMNPDATDAELLLTLPAPLRPAVEANRREAVCAVLARLDSTEGSDNMALFSSGRLNDRLPPRFGYYVGYLVASEAGRTRSLSELARLPSSEVRPLVERSLRSLADCPA